MQLKQYILVIIVQFTLASISQALTIDEFRQRLISTHPLFNTSKITAAIAQQEYLLAKSVDDWQLNIGSNYNYQQTDHIQSIVNGNNSRDNLSLQTSVSKNDYRTGNTVSLTHRLERSEFGSNRLALSDDIYNNVFELSYIAPLLRNRGGINDRLDIDIAAIGNKLTQYNIKQQQDDFLLVQLQIFVDLALAQSQLNIQQSRLKLADDLLDLEQRKYKDAVGERVDVLATTSDVLNIKQQIALSQQNLNSLKQQLAALLGLKVSKIISDIDLYQTYKSVGKISLRYFLNQHPQLQALTQQKAIIKRRLLSNRDEQQPDLLLNLSYLRQAENSNFGDSFFPQGDGLALGLNFSMPLGNKVNKAQNQLLLLQLSEIESRQDEILKDLTARADFLFKQLKIAKQVLDVNKQQLTTANQYVKEEQKRHKNGLTDSSAVIRAKNNANDIRLSYVQNAANYHRNYLNYQALQQNGYFKSINNLK